MREIISLIPPDHRRGCLKVALLVPVKAILDLVGVAVLLPVMMLVLDPQKLQESFLGRVYETLGFSSTGSFAMWVIVGVILVLLLKVVLSLLIIRYQNRFLMTLYRDLSSRLFISLYSRGLTYIKNQNSSRMTYNVIGVCYNFVMGYLGGWMRLLGESAFVLFMLAALLVYSPAATGMAICAFMPVVALYLLFIRKPLRDISSRENEARREQHRLLNEAFKGYSEVQVNDAFSSIQKRFTDGLDDISSYRVRSGIIQSIPSYMLELSVVAIVAGMMLFSFNATSADNMVFLSVFAVALLKLMPAVRTIIGSVSALSATRYTTEIISDIKTPGVFDLTADRQVAPMVMNSGIRVEDVSFSFPDTDGEKPVIEHLSFDIPKGSRFGIKGRTGAGKTTLFNLLLGLYQPSAGRICVDDTPITPANVDSWHKSIGYVPQDVFVSDSTILENVAFGEDAAVIDRDRVMAALESASLASFVATLPDGVDTKIGENGCRLSGGQRQRLGIARALYKQASVLFFDEATSSLDSLTEREVNQAIEELSAAHSELTIIVISHRDTTMSFCDKMLEI